MNARRDQRIQIVNTTAVGKSRYGIGPIGAVGPLCIIFLPLALIGPNAPLALAAIAVLAVGGLLLWRPAESPVLFFIFFYQWVQTSISLFASNLRGIPVAEFSGYRGDIEQAIVLSLLGIVALALGARIGMGARLARHAEQARIVASSRQLSEWFLLYLKASAIASFAQAFAWIVPGLSQPLLALASMKWAFFWMLAFASFLHPRSPKFYFLIAFGLEFALGFGGYFSDFKTVIFFSIFAAIASGVRFSPESLSPWAQQQSYCWSWG